MKTNILLSIVLPFLLSTCATGKFVKTPDLNSTSVPDTGILLVSVTSEGYPNAAITYEKAEQAGEKTYHTLAAKNYDDNYKYLPMDYTEKGVRTGSVLAVQLTAGTYHITDFWVAGFEKPGFAAYDPKKKVLGHFTIEEGQALYIGNFHTKTQYGNSLLGVKQPVSLVPVVANRWNTDKIKLEEKYPKLKALEVKIGVVGLELDLDNSNSF
jgi:hypothetical protein